MEGKKEERVWEAGKPSNETDVHVQVYLKKIKKYFFLFIKKKKFRCSFGWANFFFIAIEGRQEIIFFVPARDARVKVKIK